MPAPTPRPAGSNAAGRERTIDSGPMSGAGGGGLGGRAAKKAVARAVAPAMPQSDPSPCSHAPPPRSRGPAPMQSRAHEAATLAVVAAVPPTRAHGWCGRESEREGAHRAHTHTPARSLGGVRPGSVPDWRLRAESISGSLDRRLARGARAWALWGRARWVSRERSELARDRVNVRGRCCCAALSLTPLWVALFGTHSLRWAAYERELALLAPTTVVNRLVGPRASMAGERLASASSPMRARLCAKNARRAECLCCM